MQTDRSEKKETQKRKMDARTKGERKKRTSYFLSRHSLVNLNIFVNHSVRAFSSEQRSSNEPREVDKEIRIETFVADEDNQSVLRFERI